MGVQGARLTRANEDHENQEEILRGTKTQQEDMLKDFTILYTNADSLANKRDELKILIQNLKNQPQVIAITEVKTKSNWHMKLSEFNMEGYKIISNDLDKFNRGIIVFTKLGLQYSVVESDTNFEETIIIKVKTRLKQDIILCAVYTSPSSSDKNDSKLLSLIQELKDKYKEVVFIGDFSTREIDWNTWTSKS
jgi:endonuclease/exonuclease/phosphatase (EEP) superfamily protein YafD